MTRGLFITGTDTGVGKTFITAAIARQLREQGHKVGAYKPAVSGCIDGPNGPRWEDLETLSAAIGGEFPIEHIGPQRFRAPLAPPVSARLENRQVDAALLRAGAFWWDGLVDLLLVEGAGGLLSPMTESDNVADVARDLDYPLLIVARAGLGTINHTLLTVEAAASRGLRVAGIVLNQCTPDGDDLSIASNADELGKRCRIPILGVFPFALHAALLQQECFRKINWYELTKKAGAADGD